MKIYLIRHGMTHANRQHLYYGSTDLPLCGEGITELARLKERYASIENCTIVTSGMLRTEQTLELLFGAVPHDQDPRLREMDFGSFEMRSYEQMKDDPAYQAWICGDNEANATPGGESGLQMKARVIEAFTELCRSERDTVIVTHGGPISAIMGHLFPEEGKDRYHWQPDYGHGYVLTKENSTWSHCRLG